jgi:DNA-directed RNA polymerase specialized sigma subunit
MQISDPHFKQFAVSLERAIEKYGDLSEETLLERQKRQIETLVALETKLRRSLIAHPWGPNVYKDFVTFICDKNILAARPYFRERQTVFTNEISKALKKRSDKSLYKFHFNFAFVQYVLRSRRWNCKKGAKIVGLANDIAAMRQELIEMNMPLAISRARIFWSRTPKAQLDYMDLVQISCEGLMSAIDKFCLPYSKVFRSVAIGRMVGNFIEQYSETLVHFYPVDKRKIYRANKLVHKFSGIVDFDKLADQINDGVEVEHKTTGTEIASLMAAASTVSADATPVEVNDDGEQMDNAIQRYAADKSVQPDEQVEHKEAVVSMTWAIGHLSLLEQKVLRMYGVAV